MFWAIAGYLISLYLPVLVYVVIRLFDNAESFTGIGFMAFLIFPGLILGYAAEGVVGGWDDIKHVQSAIKSGVLSRKRAFVTGLISGAGVVVLITIIWLLASYFNSLWWFVGGLVCAALLIVVGAGGSIVYLSQWSEERKCGDAKK